MAVLLIAAGGKDTKPWIHIPVRYFKARGDPKTDWCLEIEPGPGCPGKLSMRGSS